MTFEQLLNSLGTPYDVEQANYEVVVYDVTENVNLYVIEVIFDYIERKVIIKT